ncbi:TPA: hypothetical protein ACSHSI_004687 [Serratia marcescens]
MLLLNIAPEFTFLAQTPIELRNINYLYRDLFFLIGVFTVFDEGLIMEKHPSQLLQVSGGIERSAV